MSSCTARGALRPCVGLSGKDLNGAERPQTHVVFRVELKSAARARRGIAVALAHVKQQQRVDRVRHVASGIKTERSLNPLERKAGDVFIRFSQAIEIIGETLAGGRHGQSHETLRVQFEMLWGGGEEIASIVADVNRWSPQCKRRTT
jgi:hypothetical protein